MATGFAKLNAVTQRFLDSCEAVTGWRSVGENYAEFDFVPEIEVFDAPLGVAFGEVEADELRREAGVLDDGEPGAVSCWWAFRAYNSEALYGYGYEDEARRYCRRLNGDRDINVYAREQLGPVSDAELIADLDSQRRTDGFNLADTLAELTD